MSRNLILVIAALAVAFPWNGTAKQPSVSESQTAAAAVRHIFEGKCLDCHGSHLSKPKGRFGYVMDLARVGKNPKYIVPGNPGESELYQMVLHKEMPGEDSSIDPLTAEELKTVERWIMLGAPGESNPPPAIAPPPEAPKPVIVRTLGWLGRFHSAATHFPVALLLTAVLAEAFAWFTRRDQWLFVVRFLVIAGAISAPGVALLGWFNAKFNGFTGNLTEWHRWLGIGTAAWAVVCAALICAAPCAEGSLERRRFRGALLLGAVMVSITGFLGGMLTFGVDHYSF